MPETLEDDRKNKPSSDNIKQKLTLHLKRRQQEDKKTTIVGNTNPPQPPNLATTTTIITKQTKKSKQKSAPQTPISSSGSGQITPATPGSSNSFPNTPTLMTPTTASSHQELSPNINHPESSVDGEVSSPDKQEKSSPDILTTILNSKKNSLLRDPEVILFLENALKST